MLHPSNDRVWAEDMAVLSTADFGPDENIVTVHNIRNCHYRSEFDFDLAYYDKTYDLNTVSSVDFIVVPFLESVSLAHTMMSFGFDNGDHLGVSVEIRREKDESFAIWKGSARQYELIYVLADERDLITLRANYRLSGVYLYPMKASREQSRALLVDVLERVNKLSREPEFYDTLTNNCTTNIVRHVNHVVPGRVPYTWQVLLPGYADRFAYQLGLIDTEDSFAATKQKARINELAYRYRDAPDFSTEIRRR